MPVKSSTDSFPYWSLYTRVVAAAAIPGSPLASMIDSGGALRLDRVDAIVAFFVVTVELALPEDSLPDSSSTAMVEILPLPTPPTAN